MGLLSNKLRCKWAREKIHSSKARLNGMPAGLIKPSLRCAHTEKWALAFTRLRLTCASKLPCCFCERVTASQLADHLLVSPVRITQVFESCSYQGSWMVWCHSFMVGLQAWQVPAVWSTGSWGDCEWVSADCNQPPSTSPDLSVCPAAPTPVGWGQEGYLCCYQG